MKDGTPPQDSDDAPPMAHAIDDAHHMTAEVRILATTDIHMQVLGHDYVQDKSVGHHGLAGLASLIKDARAEATHQGVSCVLVDNGDMLQGSAVGDVLAQTPVTPTHPVLQSLNAMAYDVIGIGNHDLDHGLPYLQRLAGLSRAPFVSSNLVLDCDSTIETSTLIQCPCSDQPLGASPSITIGFLSVMPALTNVWNKPVLEGCGQIVSAKKALSDEIPRLRARGADVVVLLAHMGIEDEGMGDDVRALTTLPGIDAVIAGHTHRRLPGQDHVGCTDVDIHKSALGACPAAMPGFNASDLAVLDLSLTRTKDGPWRLTDHTAQLRANTDAVKPDREVMAIFAPAHIKTRASLAEPVGYSAHRLQNYFSLAVPTPTSALVASTKYRIVAAELRGTPDATLPILATASADTAGGRGGPDHFLDVPPGKIYRRALAGLSPYRNTISALRVTGADLRMWLEHTVEIYADLAPKSPNQPLLRADRPTFHFDTIYGLTYGVDPTQPQGCRITFMHHDGQAVRADQRFILATNQFRAAGGGGGAKFDLPQIACHTDIFVTDALLGTLASECWAYHVGTVPWTFDCATSVQAVLNTSAQALHHLADIAHLDPTPLPKDVQGFTPIRLTL